MAERFDKEAVYDEQVFPLMDQIIAICKEHEIPMVASFYIRDDGEDDGEDEGLYCSSALTAFPHTPANLKAALGAVKGRPQLLALTITRKN